MKKIIYFIALLFLQFTAGYGITYGAANVTLTTTAVAAADLNQGTNTNIVYITKMDVTIAPVTVNNIQFTLSGNHDIDDLSTVAVYFNPVSPVISGAAFLGSTPATFAAPHAYSINVFSQIAAGASGYYIIVVNVSSSASDNKTIRITGATTPVIFGFSTATNITNNQNNGGGIQTIQAADITLTTSAVPAADLNQGTNTNIVYITKMDVTTEPVTVSNIQFTLSGNHDNDDLSTVAVYFNPVSPVISGAAFLGSTPATFAAPHAYSINIFRQIAAGASGYFIIVVNVSSSATDNKTVKITGATTPVLFGFSTSPNTTNNQNNGGGTQTIQAADINLTTSAVPAADLNQGTNTNIVYITKMDVTTEPLTVSNIQFTLSGNHDNDDLSTVAVYFNPVSPVISGAAFLGSTPATFAAPHVYSINLFRQIAAGSGGYFIIVVNVNSTATDNHTVFLNGKADPVIFGYSTLPNSINKQKNLAGKQTIQAADITLTTSAVLAADLNQGTNTNIVYITKMDVTTEPATVSNIQFTLSGNHDNDDLSTVAVYFNPVSPVISGAAFLGSAPATFVAPHHYSINIFRQIAAGASGYFIIVVNVISSASDNKTVKINGATTPVLFEFSTLPNITNSQNNGGGLQTIQAADITLTSSAVAAADLNQGTNTNIVYITKMDVTTEPVTVNNIQFTLSGNHDNDDLSTVAVYFNPVSPVISGAAFLGSTPATFAAPHAYSINIFRQIVASTSGYFIIVVNVNSSASDNKTVKITGATTPILFGFSTVPNIINNQNNGGGTQTIQAADITLTTSAVSAGNIVVGTNTNIVYTAKMDVVTEPVTVNNIQFTLSGSHDNNDLSTVSVYFNPVSPVIAGAAFLGSTPATFAGPHAYSINIFRAMATGSSGYFIITVNVAATATFGNTVTINGNTNPVVFGYSTSPNITNNQNNGAGIKTISASFSAQVSNNKTTPTIVTANTNKVWINAIFPNPAKDVLNVEINAEKKEKLTVKITDFYGKILITKKPSITKGICRLYLNVQSFANGIYYLTVEDEKNTPLVRKEIVVYH